MSDWKELTGESQVRWNEIAGFWDDYMGEHSNRFHREIIRPGTEHLLEVAEGHEVLDIGCGNGNFARRLAELGAHVTAVDYSSEMIRRAKARSAGVMERIDYRVVDATDHDALLSLGEERFDRAVSNMALMDISDITVLAQALHKLLRKHGTFVFSIMHPCFQPPGLRKIHDKVDKDGHIVSEHRIQIYKYLEPEPMESIGIQGQPVPHLVFHRPLSYYMNVFFASGFVLTGLEEPSFHKDGLEQDKFDWFEIPPAVIFRFQKV
ncbi:class I SAM-dependent methyltransferase [Paenibacillus ihbetae]|uniref:Methyltransferase type 11 domain-containing protein n=1 Tax=Paenibacillus ihbetae TaxID=1870820 RepID=A0A1B2DXU9_9BACL|nr:class I SAM-dependent methyltransferase [Paenibacillus ihbetae]ANY72564.1 hypothetical protein BBD41_08195 [Paenibacillus ihbetae]OOC58468.1 hypothetical protein BBD40_22425 [Paenibacillus ihbetae]